MPEGPECRAIALSLWTDLRGRSLVEFTYNPAKINRIHQKDVAKYEPFKRMLPRKVVAMSAKGKKIVFWFEGEVFLVSSLGMTGGWIWSPKDHSHLSLKWDDGRRLYYNDARMFGSLVICFGRAELTAYFADIGPCLLSERDRVTPEAWRTALTNPRLGNKEVGSFLLDQKRFSGIGNYLKCEILYRARVSPYRVLSSLKEEEIERLRVAALTTIEESFHAGGYTMQDYLDPYGRKGEFKCQVYGRDRDPEGRKVEQIELKDHRTTYWVPEVQR